MSQASSKAGDALVMRGIFVRFGPTIALDGVDFALKAGEVHAVIGQNGAGKSTLMNVLSGSVCPDSGCMQVFSSPYQPKDPRDARLAGVAMIHQELALAPHLSIMENIFLGLESAVFGVLKRREMRERAHKALAELGHEIDPRARVKDLSVAEQQLVEIARANAIGCRILVLDEPTSSLTQADTTRLFKLVRRLKSQGYSVVYISHFLEEVAEIADRYTVLRDGKVSGTGLICETTIDRLVNLMVGQDVGELYPRSQRQKGKEVLRLESLCANSRLQSASLTLHEGEVLGIFGLVGSGRTELLRAIFGLDEVLSGKVQVGLLEGQASPGLRWRQKVGMVSEDRKGEGLAMPLSVAENIVLSNPASAERFGLLRRSAVAEIGAKWALELSVRCQGPEQPVKHLSGGNQQKVALARLLHHGVDVLLLDEPTRGIDILSKREIYALIDQLAVRGAAVLLVSSYLPELLGVCDSIAVMCRGRLLPARPVGQVTESTIMREATGSNGGQA